MRPSKYLQVVPLLIMGLPNDQAQDLPDDHLSPQLLINFLGFGTPRRQQLVTFPTIW